MELWFVVLFNFFFLNYFFFYLCSIKDLNKIYIREFDVVVVIFGGSVVFFDVKNMEFIIGSFDNLCLVG